MRVGVKREAEVKVFLSSLNKTTVCTFNAQSGRADRRQSVGRTLSQQLRRYCFKFEKIDNKPDK